MPKIVDHDAYSRTLAQRAARYFSEHGYAGTSMRKVAAHLGLSKSALYHYFPTKEALFLACTAQVMAGFETFAVDPDASEEENLARLRTGLREDFAREMALLFDYLRGKSRTEIAQDEAMQLALGAYLEVLGTIVGQDRAEQALRDLIGRLMVDYMAGRAE